MQRLLIVEDSPEIQELICELLGSWYEINVCSTMRDALELLKTMTFDGVILDLHLPDGSGFQLCTWLRAQAKHRDLPVIFLTGADQSTEKVMAFSIGADDYVVKPFDSLELLARVRKRIGARVHQASSETLSKGKLRLDFAMLKAVDVSGAAERNLNLTPIEFRILSLLMRNEGQIFSRSDIMREIWPGSVHVTEASVYTHLSALRRKLDQLRDCVLSLPNVGYQFNPDASQPA